MRPCDCRDQQDLKKLDHTGISFNHDSIELSPNVVTLTIGFCAVKLTQNRFEAFARWYLEDQDYLKKNKKE